MRFIFNPVIWLMFLLGVSGLYGQSGTVYGNAIPIRVWSESELAFDSSGGARIDSTGWFLGPDPDHPVTSITRSDSQPGVPTIGSWKAKQDFGTVRVAPFKTYQLEIGAILFLGGKVCVVAPQGYRVKLEGSDGTNTIPGSSSTIFYQNNSQSLTTSLTVNITVEPLLASASVQPAGISSALVPGRMEWHVSMGGGLDGKSAGELVLFDPATDADWGGIFNSSALRINQDGNEIYTKSTLGSDNQYHSQFVSNETVVSLTQLSPAGFTLAFYSPEQATSDSHVYTGDPFVTYRVEKGDTETSLKITQETRDVSSATDSNLAVVTRRITSMVRSGTWPAFKWEVKDWTRDGATPTAIHLAEGSGTAEDRSVVNTTKASDGTLAWASGETYHQYAFGEALAKQTQGDGLGMETNYVYNETASDEQRYGLLKNKTTSDGGWESYVYETLGPFGNDPFYFGLVGERHGPWQNSPLSPSIEKNVGEYTDYLYSTDPLGYPSRPGGQRHFVNGVLTAQTTISYLNDASMGGMNLATATRHDFANTGFGPPPDQYIGGLKTLNRYFREDTIDPFYRRKIHAVTYPDGTKTSYVYQRGVWNGTTFTPSANAGLSTGPGSRLVTINGNASTGVLYTAYGDYDIEDLHLIDGKSMMDVAIRDQRALLVRTEHYVWSAGWQLIGWINYRYTIAGRLKEKEESTGALAKYTYSGLDLDSTIDDSGIVVSHTYDDAGRVATSAKAEGPTTQFKYDAAGRVITQTLISDSTESLVTSRTYDSAGRLTSETAPGIGAVIHSYDVANRTHTITNPAQKTVIRTYCLDGSTSSETGTAVVSKYLQYSVSDNGYRTTQTRLGSATSARTSKTTVDWLDRITKTETPAFGGQTSIVEETSYIDSGGPGTGKKSKVTRTGSADVLFEYDADGDLVRSGSDFDGNGLVIDSNDRITDQIQTFEQSDGSWWQRTEKWAYPVAGSASKVSTGRVRMRLTNFPANVRSEIQTTDREGNVTTESVAIDRSAKKVTTTRTQSGLTQGDEISVVVNGLAVSSTTHDGLTSTTHFDALERISGTTDSRGNSSTVTYLNGTLLVDTASDALGQVVTTSTYDTSGRTITAKDAVGNVTRFEYNDRGQILRQWGTGSTPVENQYDAIFGDRTGLSTFRTESGWDSASWPVNPPPDTTTWVYDAPTGLVSFKNDAAGKTVSYTYNVRGQPLTITFPRTPSTSSTATYTYFDATGELQSIVYSDGTPGIYYGTAATGAPSSYTRLGAPTEVTDATGKRTFSYDGTKPWRVKAENLSGFYGSKVFTQLYDDSQVKGRGVGFQLGESQGSSSILEQDYGFTSGGRLDSIASSAAGSRVFRYGYLADSGLVSSLSVDGTGFSVARSYEAARNVLTSIETKWDAAVVSGFSYAVNAKMQRISAKQYGGAFADYGGSTYQRFSYNDRGELVGATSYLGEDPSNSASSRTMPGRLHQFAYDPAGNRTSANLTGNALFSENYTPNALNQYASKENKALLVSGVADAAANVALVNNSALADRQGAFWSKPLSVDNIGQPWRGDVTVFSGKAGAASAQRSTLTQEMPASSQIFAYDLSGNLTSDGIWDYQWDAENRLLRMETTTSAQGRGYPRRILDFVYDYLGRRVQKRVTDGNGNEILSRRFAYVDWMLVAEFDAPGGLMLGSVKRSYVWGLDLIGSLTSSGGVGALLQVVDYPSGKRYFAGNDGNGNVASLIDSAAGTIAAAYEYDPFGKPLREEAIDSIVADQPFRFSTKYKDVETGLLFYGKRYYSASLGRFINRDPIEESGGINLYAFCRNDGVNGIDVLGMGDKNAEIPVGDTVISNPLVIHGDRLTEVGIAISGGSFQRPPSFSLEIFFDPTKNPLFGFPLDYKQGLVDKKALDSQTKTGANRIGIQIHPADKASAKKLVKDIIDKAHAEGKTVFWHRPDGSIVVLLPDNPNRGAWWMNMQMVPGGGGPTFGQFQDSVAQSTKLWGGRIDAFGAAGALALYGTGIGKITEGYIGWNVGEEREMGFLERGLSILDGESQAVGIYSGIRLTFAAETTGIRLSEKGLSLVENHLATFEEFAPNTEMIGRLRTAFANGEKVIGADANFYLHEASEATMMGRGMGYDAAHAAALEKYGVSNFSLYHPEVIQANPGSFNSNWFNFWNLPPKP